MPDYPYRECSSCRIALEPEEIPVWRGSGTDEDPHRIERWATFLKCPRCKHARALKNPWGDRRRNRKTTRTATGEIDTLIETGDRSVLYGMVLALYECQTDEEQDEGETIERNCRGFNGCDANFLSSVAAYGRVSVGQEPYVRDSLKKYSRQLQKIYRASDGVEGVA